MIEDSHGVACSRWFGSAKSLSTHTCASKDKQLRGPQQFLKSPDII